MTDSTFEDLGVPPELVEALAAEGAEAPTEFQREAIPVLRKGNPLLGGVGPGAGTLVAYGTAILERVDPSAPGLGALVIAPTAEAADQLAGSLARLAVVTGHRVAALGPGWALPERAQILFGSPEVLMAGVKASRVQLGDLLVLVVDGASAMEGLGTLEIVSTLLDSAPKDTQKVLLSMPLTPGVRALATAQLRRAIQVPSRPAVEDGPTKATQRGQVQYRVVEDSREETLVREVSRLLQEEELAHVLLFCRSEDRAADAGDLLALHGFPAGAPGDPDSAVWLGVDELEARKEVEAYTGDQGSVATVSLDVPADPDSLDRRHHLGRGIVLTLPRELPHLADIAERTGYVLVPLPEPAGAERDPVVALRDRITEAVSSRDLAGPLLVLEPLFREHSAARIAAGLLALLDSSTPREGGGSDARPVPAEERAAGSEAAAAYVRVFISLGEKDGVGPGDILGAVTGESGVQGSRVGRIEIRDSFSLVEVDQSVADRVIRSLNGVTVKGRSVRADFDRKEARREPRDPSRSPAGPRGRGGAPPRGGGAPRGGGDGAPSRGGGPARGGRGEGGGNRPPGRSGPGREAPKRPGSDRPPKRPPSGG